MPSLSVASVPSDGSVAPAYHSIPARTVQAQKAGRVTARYRRYIGSATSIAVSSIRATPETRSPLVSVGIHSLSLLPENCVLGGRCHVFMAINLGQRRPVTGANAGLQRSQKMPRLPLMLWFDSDALQSKNPDRRGDTAPAFRLP